ncbi:MAG: hypothetical protein EDM03_11020 [Porphyrobacter sp. IPPAS B-1204]|nr:MAG: hypothetical protein EDM03_11020 [Porphyrobacter sp. IPPAS B-1204]
MKLVKSLTIGAALVAAALASPAMAEETPYTLGTVWEASRIDVLPGQGPDYIQYLATTWKRNMETLKAEGYVVSYRVLATNHRRGGEPDLILLIEFKDYQTVAQIEARRARMNELTGQTNRSAAAAAAERGKMREELGTTQYQELVLK